MILSTKRISAILLAAASLYSCGGGKYEEALRLKGKEAEVVIRSRGGDLKAGDNGIEVEVKPKGKLIRLYLYMPPMPGMAEMRAPAKLKKVAESRYRGSVNIPMEGSWQVVAVLERDTLKTDVSIPLIGGKGMEGGHSSMKMSMEHGGGSGPTLTISERKLAAINVSLYTVKEGEDRVVIPVSGEVKYPPSKRYDLSPRFAGYITRVVVDREGERVSRGDVLFYTYSPELLRTYEEYRSTKSEEALAKLTLYGVRPEDFRDTTVAVRSPVSGKVEEVRASVGKRFKEGERLYGVITSDAVWFVGHVPQDKAGLIRLGDAVVVGEAVGKVISLSPTLDRRTRTLSFVSLLPGRYREGEVLVGKIVKKVKGIVVPTDAVIRTGERDYVYVEVGKNTFSPREVKVLMETEKGYVVEGLKPGERIVERGVFFIDAEASFRGIGGGKHGAH